MKTLLSGALLVVLIFIMTAAAQFAPPPGYSVFWTTNLASASAETHASGTAEYMGYKPNLRRGTGNVVYRFVATCEYVGPVSNYSVDVFVGPSATPDAPYGKFIGKMRIEGGTGILALVGSKVPVIHHGSTVNIVDDGKLIMKGTFE